VGGCGSTAAHTFGKVSLTDTRAVKQWWSVMQQLLSCVKTYNMLLGDSEAVAAVNIERHPILHTHENICIIKPQQCAGASG
jgi:hypothetical protein